MTQRPHFGLEMEQISYLVERKVLRHLKDGGFDVTFVEMVLLMTVVDQGEATPASLAIATKRDKAVVSRLVKNLLEKKYLLRKNSETDGRSHTLTPTAKATACFNHVKSQMDPFRKKFERSIPANELKIFRRILADFNEYLQADRQQLDQ